MKTESSCSWFVGGWGSVGLGGARWVSVPSSVNQWLNIQFNFSFRWVHLPTRRGRLVGLCGRGLKSNMYCNRFAKCLFKKFDWIFAFDALCARIWHCCGLFDCCLNGQYCPGTRLHCCNRNEQLPLLSSLSPLSSRAEIEKSKRQQQRQQQRQNNQNCQIKLKLCHFVVWPRQLICQPQAASLAIASLSWVLSAIVTKTKCVKPPN